MMDTPFLSIIVPVYNVEEYLGACVDSILIQSFRDFELILVDDGSIDQSGNICDDYARKDERIFVIHKKNGGLSSARNVGLDIARGQYITFVDSDDKISPDTYVRNIELIVQHPDTDILQFPTHWGKDNSDIQVISQQTFCGEHEIFANWWRGNMINFSVWNKIYRKELFFNIRFPEGHFFEDLFLMVDFSERAKKILISEYGCYYYLIRNNSISNSRYSLEKNLDLYRAHFKVYQKLYTFSHLISFRIVAFSRVFRRLIITQRTNPNADLNSYIKELNKYVPDIRDLLIARASMREIIWFFFVKLFGLSFFMILLIKYLNIKEAKIFSV